MEKYAQITQFLEKFVQPTQNLRSICPAKTTKTGVRNPIKHVHATHIADKFEQTNEKICPVD